MNGCIYRTRSDLCMKFTTDQSISFCVGKKCKDRKESNADRIRSMTDEELAVFLGNTKAFCCRDRDPSEEFIAEFKIWLKQEAVDNGACSADETSEKVQDGE